MRIADAKFIAGSRIGVDQDMILLRIPLVENETGHRVDALVRLDVQSYANHIDGSDLLDILAKVGDLPKRIEEAGKVEEAAWFYDVEKEEA